MTEMKLIREDRFGKVYSHESFGILSFNKFSGGDGLFFGSSIKHKYGGISLVISTAELHRSLSHDAYHESKDLIRVEMTETQFANAITGFGSTGSPVTISYVAGEGRKEAPPFQNKVAEFDQEFQDKMDDISKDFDEVIKLASDSKAQVRLQKAIQSLKQRMRSNVPFISKQFAEQMEKTVTEAKGEVEAFFSKTIERHGLENLRSMTPQLVEAVEQREIKHA